METVSLIINDAPYGTEKPWNALRLAGALMAAKQSVNVFLLGDAAAIAKKGHKPPAGYYNLAQMQSELIKAGAGIRACGTCLSARGEAPFFAEEKERGESDISEPKALRTR